MKAKLTLLSLLVAFGFAVFAQQIPNAGFETWTSSTNPDGWGTWESATGLPLGLTFKDTVDKVEGSASLKLITDSVQAGPQKRLIAGFASLGNVQYAPPSPISFVGLPFSYRPDTLFFAFKYTAPSADTAVVQLVFTSGDSTVLAGGVTLGVTNTWLNIYVPLTPAYVSSLTPDTIIVQFQSSLGVGVQGSTLHVDDIAFGYVNLPNALQELADRLNVAVYPNPAAEVITVATDENTSGFKISIIDISGKVMGVTNLSGQKTEIKLTEFANGTYIYRIADKSGNILKQGRFNVVK